MRPEVVQLARSPRPGLTIRGWRSNLASVPEARREAAGEDGEIVAAIVGGDRPALARLYARYASSLMAIGVRILGDRREAEDLLHDVFLEVWRHAAHYDAARGTVRAWLLMRMRSRALDRKKSAGFSRVVPLEERPAAAEAHAREDA